MGWLSDFFQNPVQTMWDTNLQIPGSPEAVTNSVYEGAQGDLSWNPWSDERSVWDYGAQGSNLSNDPQERAKGRMVGTAIGSYFTGGALGSYLGSTGGAAANGALWSGAQAAGTGQDVDKAVVRGGITGGLSSYTPDVAGYAGITNPTAAGAVNGATRGGLASWANGGDVKQGAISGGLSGGLRSYGAPPDDLQGSLGGTMQDAEGESSVTLGGITTPAQTDANYSVPSMREQPASAAPPQQESSWISPELGSFMQSILPSTRSGWGDLAQGALGMYAANKQRRMARDLRNQIGGNRNAYGTQLQRELQRRDAAAGRRSNYGGRAVELQSSLAKLDQQNAPAQAQLQQAELGGLINMFQSGLRYGDKAGWFGNRAPVTAQAPIAPVNTYTQAVPDQTSFDPYRRFRTEGGA